VLIKGKFIFSHFYIIFNWRSLNGGNRKRGSDGKKIWEKGGNGKSKTTETESKKKTKNLKTKISVYL
jgi:hypothetical protein